MSRLTQHAKNMLALLLRTEKVDGWYAVSDIVWPLLDHVPSELIERRESPKGVRLTERGTIVTDYL